MVLEKLFVDTDNGTCDCGLGRVFVGMDDIHGIVRKVSSGFVGKGGKGDVAKGLKLELLEGSGSCSLGRE